MAADEQTGQQGEAAEGESTTPSEDLKRKFREALEKKQAHGGRDVSDHSDRSKVDAPHRAESTPANTMFRRKSGP